MRDDAVANTSKVTELQHDQSQGFSVDGLPPVADLDEVLRVGAEMSERWARTLEELGR